MPKVIKDEEIYGAVMQVVSERGYASATTKQMAELAEVSEVTLFRKYETKAELVRQAISFIAKQTTLASAAHYTGDVHADLLKVAQAYQETAEKHGLFILALFSEFERHPELAHSIDQPMNIFLSIGQMIARYQSEGVLIAGTSSPCRRHPAWSLDVYHDNTQGKIGYPGTTARSISTCDEISGGTSVTIIV